MCVLDLPAYMVKLKELSVSLTVPRTQAQQSHEQLEASDEEAQQDSPLLLQTFLASDKGARQQGQDRCGSA